MRNVNRIEPFLAELKEIWEKYPDLRFWQLICAIASYDQEGPIDPFYWEEEKWLEQMRGFR